MSGKNNGQPESRIPVLSHLRRGGSLRLGTCPPIQEHIGINPRWKLNRHQSLQSLNSASSFANEQDDADSVRSFSSTCSNVSQCDHSHFARNGTTFSGRSKRYVLHCSPHSAETDDYLTPTQRTNRTIRKLRNVLKDAQEEIAQREKEILRLKKEVVELRLVEVVPCPESNDIGVGAVLGESMKNESQFSHVDNLTGFSRSRCSSPVVYSLSDSGLYEDLTSSKENSLAAQSNIRLTKTQESLQRQHEEEIRELKEKHSDKIDSLLQRITDVNDRYYTLRPLYEDCKKQMCELEKTNEKLRNNVNQNNIVKLNELEMKNEELLRDKLSLMVKMNELESMKTELKLNQLNHEKLKVEYTQLKNKEDELLKTLALKEETCKKFYKTHCGVSDRSSQTEDLKLQISYHGFSEENQPFQDCCEESSQCSYNVQDSKLKSQGVALADKVKLLEQHDQNETDMYEQLNKNDIHAAKFLNNEVMHDHLLDTRKDQPKHDPEMTLQFLKSAFYYFLTDRENARGHLSAIESILGFTDNEKINIERAFLWR